METLDIPNDNSLAWRPEPGYNLSNDSIAWARLTMAIDAFQAAESPGKRLTENVPMETIQEWVDFMEIWDTGTLSCVPEWLMPWVPLYMLDGDRLQADLVPAYRSPLQAARITLFMGHPTLDVPWKGVGYNRFKQMWLEHLEAQKPKPEPEPDYVDLYFIGSEDGPIKIGVSGNPAKRVRQIQTSYPYPLSLLAVVRGGALLEPEYHARFAEHRLNGEWFTRCPEILAEIERLSA